MYWKMHSFVDVRKSDKIVTNASVKDYEELEKQLKQVFKERSTILRQLTKTSRELDGIKTNLQNLKNDEISAKTDVQKLLEIGQKQRFIVLTNNRYVEIEQNNGSILYTVKLYGRPLPKRFLFRSKKIKRYL
ncbi:hypothetical protein JEQ12_010943 [Ovis aries]|uniref:Uncharacterized protein n=1 Tax=Ovis aries TaxID=9940 RepID=A0A836CRH0_SHEEP|nr:hypothetical protein JEQ12_010943 [Ovis aries]